LYLSFEDLSLPDDITHAQEGWRLLDPVEGDRYDSLLAPLLVRATEGGNAEALIVTGPRTRNAAGGLHGGFLASMAEQTLFLPLFVRDAVRRGGVVTIDFSLQYVAAGDTVTPLVAQVQLLHETGRLAFIRGELMQAGALLVAYSGTLRKLPRKD
jgi:acyl-coenzyme A thioesterase PaaI-like protein